MSSKCFFRLPQACDASEALKTSLSQSGVKSLPPHGGVYFEDANFGGPSGKQAPSTCDQRRQYWRTQCGEPDVDCVGCARGNEVNSAVVFHASCTNESKLCKCILKNYDASTQKWSARSSKDLENGQLSHELCRSLYSNLYQNKKFATTKTLDDGASSDDDGASSYGMSGGGSSVLSEPLGAVKSGSRDVKHAFKDVTSTIKSVGGDIKEMMLTGSEMAGMGNHLAGDFKSIKK